MNRRRYWVTATVLLLTACGGDVQPLGDVPMGGASGTGGNTDPGGRAGAQTSQTSEFAVCETECFRTIVNSGATACKVCHAANPAARLDMGTLDMESPNISARLKDLPAAHKAIIGDGVCPQGDKIIDSVHPENSWLLKKILGQQGSCGIVMPSTGALSPADQACMVTYVNCVADR